MHVPDLPLYDNTAKVGLGLWNRQILAFSLEGVLLLGAITIYVRESHVRRRPGIIGFGIVMLAIQAYIFFGPPPVSAAAAAETAHGANDVFALAIWFLGDRMAIRQVG